MNASNRINFVVEFDSEVWATLSENERQDWVNRAHDKISEEGYVSEITSA